MSTEPYVPDRGTVRYRYADGDFSGGNRDPHAEFDRFIAKIKAAALREAATEFEVRLPDGTGNGRAYNSYRVAELLRDRADRIEEEA